MTNEQFKSLRRGDIIRGIGTGTSFVVDAHYGDFVVAMKTMHVSNPDEWELCAYEKQGAAHNNARDEIVTLRKCSECGISFCDRRRKEDGLCLYKFTS